jgi:ATP-dependent helicase/nuclease subunit B
MPDAPVTPSVQRVFLGWDGPALPRAAQRLGEEYAGGGELDLRRVVVVTPAARAGRRLGELLLDEAATLGAPLTPPRAVTMGRFPELLYDPHGPLADSTATRHAFAQALKEFDPKILKILFPTLPQSMSGWMGLAKVVEGLHREVGGEGLDFGEVDKAFQRGFPYDDSPRWKVLSAVQTDYLALLQKAGLGDRDRERKRALEEGRLSSPGEVWLVGAVELPGMVRQMVRALPGPVRALVHAPQTLHDGFDGLGCVVPEFWSTAPIPLDPSKIRMVQRPPDQAHAVVSVLQEYSGRFRAEEVVVGIPDPELVPYVERGLTMADVPHRFAGGTPLADSGPARLLHALAEYLNGKSYPSFAALIRHPDLYDLLKEGGGGGELDQSEGRELTGPLTDVDRFQTRHLQVGVQGPLPGGDKYAQRMRELVDGMEAALGLEEMTGSRPLSEWMGKLLEILVRVYGGEPLDLGSRGVRHLVEALTRIKGAAGRLALLPGTLDGEVEGWEALALLVAEFQGEAIPPDPQEHAVELLGWLELPLDDAPGVVVTGVNDRHIPESCGADPFLPGALRSHLGIPDDDARYARDAYLLSSLTQSRESVHLVAGRLTASGDPLKPSRLLFATSEEEVARRMMWFLGDTEGADPPLDPAPPEAPITDGVEGDRGESRFRSPPENPLPALSELTRIRVTDFAPYLTDPYRYALTRVLNLESLDDGSREMEGMTFGSLAHLVLERFGKAEEAASPDPEVVARKLDRLLDGAVHEEFGRRPVPAVTVQVEQLRVRLHAFARWQAAWAEEGWRVVDVEAQPGEGLDFEVDGKPVLLRGKIDRIDHNPETGEWAIFDYKTADAGTDPEKAHRKGRGENRRWVDLQLPLYRVLLPGILAEDGTPVIPAEDHSGVKMGYLLLSKRVEEVGASFAQWTEEELAEAVEEARGVVRALRQESFSYDPATRSYRDDPFDALLGRKELPKAADEEEEGSE